MHRKLIVLSLLVIVSVHCQAPQWGECYFSSTVEGVQCSNVTVPLDWTDSSNSEEIYLYVSKVPRDQNVPYTGTIFFLNGGSGVGGACFAKNPAPWIRYYNSLGLDFVAPDFRGAGDSFPKLFCPGDPAGANVPDVECAELFQARYGSTGMYYWSITQGAYDLNYLISTLGGELNYVQGFSFGTFWGNRFLQVFPNAADAAHFDSFGSPNRYEYFLAYELVDWVGTSLLHKCTEDAFCGSNAGNGYPVDVNLRNLLEEAERGTLPCIASLPPQLEGTSWVSTFQQLFGALLGPKQVQLALVPPLLYRVRRCSSEDVDVIVHLWNLLFTPTNATVEPTDCSISSVILYNLFMSEGVQNPPPPPLETTLAHTKFSLFSAPVALLEESYVLYDTWPKYAWDQYVHGYPKVEIPLLLTNGDLDISTPWAQAIFSTHYYNTSIVKLPNCPHVSLLYSPVTNSLIPCGIQIAAQFFSSPERPINTTCVSYLKGIDWTVSTPMGKLTSQQFFGTSDAWGF